MVQRTEIVLRVNATTSDAASQTELLDDLEERLKEKEILPEPRKKLLEEIECEELSRDLASQLSPNDKLVPILGKIVFLSSFSFVFFFLSIFFLFLSIFFLYHFPFSKFSPKSKVSV